LYYKLKKGGEKMRKQGAILGLTIVMAILLCGAVSATDPSTDGDVLSSNQSMNMSANSESQVQNTQPVDPIIGVKVNYPYSSDSGINPEIKVKDSNGAAINFTKSYDSAFQGYKVSFNYPGAANGTKFNLSVSAPGYITQEQQIAVYTSSDISDPNFYGSATFNMQATAAYKLGRDVTAKADQLLNFAGADNVLAITTAGVPKLNGSTSEDCIEGILNGSNGKISYGKGNILMLRQTATDPVDFAFITKKGNSLQAVCFRNGSSTPVYVGTISENMTKVQWNNFLAKVGSANTFSYASLANAWADGAPADLLREAAFHGHVCQGTISGYSITQAIMKFYPPIQETSGGSGSPGDITSYKVIGATGDSVDDAAMYFFDATPGKGGYSGFDTSATGANSSMLAFIRWNDNTKTGDLIIMRFKRDENRAAFEKETGITLEGNLAELKFNTWILNKIQTHPEELVEFYRELTGLNETQYYYLLGTATNITNTNGTVRIPAQQAHGLDMAYIDSLKLANATRVTPAASTAGNLSYDQMKDIGVQAANLAKQIFKNELGIDIEKDDRDLAVLTSAGYVYLNGQTTEATWDGIYQVLGSRLSRSTLLPVHTGVWKPLWFAFVLRGSDGTTLSSIYMRYDNQTQQFIIGNGSNVPQVNDIGPAALNNATQDSYLGSKVFVDGNFFNIQSISNAWRNNPAFDQIVTFLFHDHACPGVQPGFFISDYILKNIPLGEGQDYTYIGDSIYCKDDSLVYLLDISPGMGTYLNQRLPNDEVTSDFDMLPGGTEEGIIAVWDNKLKVAHVYVINFKWADIDTSDLKTSDAKREATIAAYISIYSGHPNSRVKNPSVVMTTNENYLSESQFKTLKQGGKDGLSALNYFKSISKQNLSDLVKVQGGNSNPTQGSQGTSTQGVSQSNGSNGASQGSGSSDSQGSIGNLATVSAATQTVATTTPGDTGDQGQKSYEISKTDSTGSSKSDFPVTAAIVGVILVVGLAGVGFLYKGGVFGQ
jgi:formylmethanofuran dehydrogenase subunit E-like metal-binding protein